MSTHWSPTSHSLAACHTCRRVVDLPEGDEHAEIDCPRCGEPIHRRKPDSINRTWAFLIAATVCYLHATLADSVKADVRVTLNGTDI